MERTWSSVCQPEGAACVCVCVALPFQSTADPPASQESTQPHLEEAGAALLVDGDEHADDTQWAHVRMLVVVGGVDGWMVRRSRRSSESGVGGEEEGGVACLHPHQQPAHPPTPDPSPHLRVDLGLVRQHLGQVVNRHLIAVGEPELSRLVASLLDH